jgi:hypothetical protein
MQIVERKSRSFIIDGIVDREVRSRNFKGEEKKDQVTGRTVNGPGRRNFLLRISEDIAEELKDHGCEVKYTKVQNPNDVPEPYVSITVSYYLRPVEACVISNGVMTPLDEAHIGRIDNMDIKNMAIELEYGKEKIHQNGTKYIPLYAQQIWVEIVPSYFAEKYAYLNTSPMPEDQPPFDVN